MRGAGQDKLGIYIKSVVKGGAADVDGQLQAGDQLLKVDGQSLVGITQEKAAEYLVRTGSVVVLEVGKQGAIYHGLATLLQQPSPVMTRDIKRSNINVCCPDCGNTCVHSLGRIEDKNIVKEWIPTIDVTQTVIQDKKAHQAFKTSKAVRQEPSREQELTIPRPSKEQEPTIPGPSIEQNLTIPGPSIFQEPTVQGPSRGKEPTVQRPSKEQEFTVPEPSRKQELTIPGPSREQEPTIPGPSRKQKLTIPGPSIVQEPTIQGPSREQE
uniref:PDZ domain-containing protein n=1 Tax=Timema tahoe TaxID=61484 RepID=A0A7R9IRW5_9NEOP|nr:unnamed protein product [Timema tahoe]